MNKEKFLAELRGYLSVLESREQDDICAEYAQHIDMKIQKGLSEEEAIRDFGPVEQLAAGILEAYHVNPEFRRQGFSFKLPKPGTGTFRNSMQSKAAQGFGALRNPDDQEQKAEPRLHRIGTWIKKTTAKAARGIGNAFRWLGGKCRAFAGFVRKLFTRKREEINGEIREGMTEKEGAGSVAKTIGSACRMTGRGIAALWRGFVALCIFCLKFMWNAAWLLFALICAGMAMITLLGAGMIVVFLVQGYPFIGFFLISLGGLLCFGALAYGSFGLLIRKKESGKDDNRREEAGPDEGERKETEEPGENRKEAAGDDCDSRRDGEAAGVGGNKREEAEDGGCSRQEVMIQKYDREAVYEQTT